METRAKEMAEVVNKFSATYTDNPSNRIIIGLAICFHQSFTTPWKWIGKQHLYRAPNEHYNGQDGSLKSISETGHPISLNDTQKVSISVDCNPITGRQWYTQIHYDDIHAEFFTDQAVWHVNITELKTFLSAINLNACSMFRRVMYFIYMLSVCDTRSYTQQSDDPKTDFNTNVEDMWVQLQLILHMLEATRHHKGGGVPGCAVVPTTVNPTCPEMPEFPYAKPCGALPLDKAFMDAGCSK